MSTIAVIWSMTASACLTLALIHLLIWSRQRSLRVNLLFSTAAVGTAGVAVCELIGARAQTPAAYSLVLRWGHVPVWVIIVSLCGFAKLYFRVRHSRWLGAAALLRTVSLALNFLTGENLNYLRITALRHVRLFNESIAVPTGVPNPAMVVGQLGLVLLIIGVAKSARVAWKRGDRQKAVVVGGSIVFFVLASSIESSLIFWRNYNFPITVSFFYMGFILAMSYELSTDLLVAARLADELRESEKRMMIAAQAATLGEISSALAHELNQPLAAILSNAQAAQRFLSKEVVDHGELREILADIVSDDQRAGEVIRKMRNLLKRGLLQPQPMDCNMLILDALKLLSSDLSARGITVVTELANHLPQVFGDPVQYQQVLINLIRNATDAMSETPPEARTITLRTATLGDGFVRITVADTGPGMPLGHEEKIFEQYYTTRPAGLGLGLSLSRRIAVAYGATLIAERHTGKGAVFSFSIPSANEGPSEVRSFRADRVPGG